MQLREIIEVHGAMVRRIATIYERNADAVDDLAQDVWIALWQTAPKPDTQHLLRDVQRQNRMHRQFNRALVTIVCGVSLLLIFEEVTRRIATHGWLSAIWILCLVAGAVWRYGV